MTHDSRPPRAGARNLTQSEMDVLARLDVTEKDLTGENHDE